MAASPQAMQQMTGAAGGAGGAMPPGGGPPQPGAPQQPGPAAAPMMTPKKPGGVMEGARVDCLLAQKKLEQALATFGSNSDEGKGILDAIRALSKAFGKQEGDTEQLMPAEIKQMLQGLPGPGAMPAGMKPPGGAPPGMPPQQ